MWRVWRWVRSGAALLLCAALCAVWLYYGGLVASSPLAPLTLRPRAPKPLLAPPECSPGTEAVADIDTVRQFPKFDFQPYWMKSREYWDANFESRYKARKRQWPQLPLKVIVVPHSHNDPGWLKTFESYYHYQTRNILNNMADRLPAFLNMTFIWSEIAFFSQWWQSAHPTKRRVVKKLIEDGRLEITTGGWVMTDEATTHVYAMLDQLIEGHQWLRSNIGVSPRSGWSIDPFGHGGTVPYLLREAGVDEGTVVQRLHYAWKQWLAATGTGDFLWRQPWDSQGRVDLLVHNLPFDIYSIKHSCGPHPQVCLNFDFRKVSGEYTEYSLRAVAIDDGNVRAKAELLLEQYGRTGSLLPHNVVLVPVGDDFRYDRDVEWTQQYSNYNKLFDYINSHPERYHAEVKFGTPVDYFRAVRERSTRFKTLKGDFFVYSDIFSEGRPAYWSGYFTTRPYWKALDRELEAELRSAEILYTLTLNRARRSNATLKVLEREFEKLTRARRALALFQHHDAITGTSKGFVMHDYALKLFEGARESVAVQTYAVASLLGIPVVSDTEREGYETPPRRIPLRPPKTFFVFNSFPRGRTEPVRVRVTTPDVEVVDTRGEAVLFQVEPVWNASDLTASDRLFEVFFLADLLPLSVNAFTLRTPRVPDANARAKLYCRRCNGSVAFRAETVRSGQIRLENGRLRLETDGRTGFLQAVVDKTTGRRTQVSLGFGAYPSAQFHSGAYLFMPDPNSRETERDVLEEQPEPRLVVLAGPVSSEITVVYGNLLTHTIRLYHAEGVLGRGVYMENRVDFEAPPKNRETELFMRLVTDISNGEPPQFYTDTNGFAFQKRVKVARIGIEGNYFPVTTETYIEDGERRVTLLVGHSQGAASWQPGWLEVMLDRRTLYDDSRGMGEGVIDNKPTLGRYWLLVEATGSSSSSSSSSSSELSRRLLYPGDIFVAEGSASSESLPLMEGESSPGVHLMNLRTLPDSQLPQFPSFSSLMILSAPPLCSSQAFSPGTSFLGLPPPLLSSTTLTGLRTLSPVASLDSIRLLPHRLATFNLTFVPD